MEIREQRAQEISAELQGETWENIPELDPKLLDAALNRLETLVLQFDDDVEEMGRKKHGIHFKRAANILLFPRGSIQKSAKKSACK